MGPREEDCQLGVGYPRINTLGPLCHGLRCGLCWDGTQLLPNAASSHPSLDRHAPHLSTSTQPTAVENVLCLLGSGGVMCSRENLAPIHE